MTKQDRHRQVFKCVTSLPLSSRDLERLAMGKNIIVNFPEVLCSVKLCRFLIQRSMIGTSLVVQWLRLRTPNAGGRALIPGQGHTLTTTPPLTLWKPSVLSLWIHLFQIFHKSGIIQYMNFLSGFFCLAYCFRGSSMW